MSVKFRVNDEIVELYPAPEDEEDTTCNKLRVDDAYAIEMIQQLAETGQIEVIQPITKITRFLTETDEQFIYDIDLQKFINEPATDSSNLTSDKTAPENLENRDPNERCSDNNLWSEAQTKFILDNYHLHMKNIGPMKQFKTKKMMWNQIALDLSITLQIEKTALQVENRYKTLIRKKKVAVENNSKSGRSRQIVPYEEELGKIAGLDDSIDKEVIRSSRDIKVLKQPIAESASDECRKSHQNPKRKKRRTSSVVETLRKLQQEREDAKAARHREKLELIRELFPKKTD